ncbi:MAG: general secretion pathway protein GspB [Ideonella sp.]|nr:general secretion pathway protein GspB [Ideonella sp.]MCC7455820.1 general secretion pathway protein GspB [Nitrospira sp.]
MSYILEALRRAESERERRRGVPGLHTQAMPGAPAERDTARHSRPWLWAVIGVSAGVLLPLLYRAVTGGAAPAEDALARAPVSGNVAAHEAGQAGPNAPATVPAALPAAATASVPAPATPAAHTAAVKPEATTATAPHHAQAQPGPTRHASASPQASSSAHTSARPGRGTNAHTPAPTRAALASATRTERAAPAPAGARTAAPVAPSPPPPAPEPRLRTLAELPDELRRSVPQLNFGGSVYSEVPAQRMVILNGQVLREGDAVASDLVLERIRPHSVVLHLRGERFQITF